MMPPTVDAKVNPNVPRYNPPKRGRDAMEDAPASGAFEDALFMVAVRPVDEANEEDTLPLFQSVMPRTSVVASDARGGIAARAPSRGVELLTKHRVSLALFSRDGALRADGSQSASSLGASLLQHAPTGPVRGRRQRGRLGSPAAVAQQSRVAAAAPRPRPAISIYCGGLRRPRRDETYCF